MSIVDYIASRRHLQLLLLFMVHTSVTHKTYANRRHISLCVLCVIQYDTNDIKIVPAMLQRLVLDCTTNKKNNRTDYLTTPRRDAIKTE